MGETDGTNLPGGRITYMRWVTGVNGRTAQGTAGSYALYCSPFLHWDPTGTATNPGNGIGGMKFNGETACAATPTPTSISNSPTVPVLDNGTGAVDLLSQGRAGLPFDLYRRDLVMISDADEWFIYVNNSGLTNSWWSVGMSALNNTGSQVASNLYTGTLAATSSTSAFNTGTVDFSTKGYQVGDNITVRGLSTSTPEYIETGVISSFSGSSPNFTVNVSPALSRTYGNGSDGGVLAYIGEDPYPIATWTATSSTPAVRLHNISKGLFATGKDYDLTNFGTTGAMNNGLSSLAELIPNRRTGKFGMTPVFVKVTTNTEFRGKWKFVNVVDNTRLTQGKKLLDPINNNAYVVVIPSLTGGCAVFGPIPIQQAGVKV